MDWILKRTCVQCSPVSPTIPLIESKNFCRGMSLCPALAILALTCLNASDDAIMHWQLLDSSVFTATAYALAKHILYLRFRSGELYRYTDFPPDLYRDFLAADSKGQYFARHIRARFT